MSYVWGLLPILICEMQVINRENETISHHYTQCHVLLMAAISRFAPSLHYGHNFMMAPSPEVISVYRLALAVCFYGVALAGVADGRGLRMAQLSAASVTAYPYVLSRATLHLAVFGGLWRPLVWLCALVGTVALSTPATCLPVFIS